MRKWIPTVLLLVVLGAGIIYAKSQNFFREQAPAARQLVQLTQGDITSFAITGKDGKSVELDQHDGKWSMSKPRSYPLNQYTLDNWLAAIQNIKLGDVVESSPKDVAKYGISATHDQVEIKTKNGDVRTFAFGDTLPSGDAVYVLSDQKEIASVPIDTLSGLLLGVDDFTDTTPFDWDDTKLSGIEWEGQNASWMLRSSGNSGTGDSASASWTLNGKSVAGDTATSLSQQIKNLTSNQALRKASELNKPVHRFTLSISLGKQDSQVVYQGWTLNDDPETVWVVPPQSNWAYGLSASDVNHAEQNGHDQAKASQ
ncbi:DUF4340 domain-containing protein [Paenibacillus polymyxa]|uniref:DUF4340 domain-containing protein n=1 Tax=Paenibacillus TaxID=44249 RepID=UPI000E3D4EBC|nr:MULTISPECIES: DUF4340 domain-containing protein [Paenibacillus]KAF6617779.1 DUF4340 domain-containing protein [Paenibacillus sp. EKM101P]KAF6618588.1 DUF4340 domain-containing protein [Paenibacillus sp. EKM102P]KAF6626925.1 DUF4340 domain-containing protein [Paenibacillus sp. EKM10P]KAF6646335.1 DUF4340 domain-containing protein [Paenibacillus sp. EKM11P]MBY0024727.1 DUF4340 domain-containing protein [Paenibacillus polymyxa]